MIEHRPREDTVDIKEQERTYGSFMAWTKYSVVVIVAILALMALFLT